MNAHPVTLHQETINRLIASVEAGKHWYLALLEAIRDYPEKNYLVGGEALDWMKMAALLVEQISGLAPPDEVAAFLEKGKPPVKVPPEDARRLVGQVKYNLYLNYLYGITVESALVRAVTDEVTREIKSAGLVRTKNTDSEVYVRIYGLDRKALQAMFAGEMNGKPPGSSGDEFTYCLFKYRLKHSDKEKVASDTKKALNWLQGPGSYFPRLF